MTAHSPSAFALSALLHAGVVALVLLGIYYSQLHTPKRPVIFELVAGEGNNYAATEAPALGSPGGPVKLSIPKTVPAPAQVTPKVIEESPPQLVPIQIPKKAKPQAKAEPAAEKSHLSKAEFDRLHGKSATPKTALASTRVAHVPRIDAQGIAKGVVGGSTANKTGGAGGKALRREEQSLVDSYIAFLSQQLHTAFDEAKPPGLSDRLEAIVELRVLSDGTLSDAHIIQSSGSDEFDRAVLEAIARVRPLGTRPPGLDEVLKIPFRMLDDSTKG